MKRGKENREMNITFPMTLIFKTLKSYSIHASIDGALDFQTHFPVFTQAVVHTCTLALRRYFPLINVVVKGIYLVVTTFLTKSSRST